MQKWFIAGVAVFVRRGRLMVRPLTPVPALAHAFPLYPDDDTDPYVFRIDLSAFGIGTTRVVFTQQPAAGTTALHPALAPLSFDNRPATSNPRAMAIGALGALAVASAATAARRRRILITERRRQP